MASLSPDDNFVSPIQQLQDLCFEKNLECKYHNCHILSSLPPNFNACVTVKDITIQGRGKTMRAAKEKAATQMLDYLEGRSSNLEFPPKEGEKKSVTNTGDPEKKKICLQHPCSRLQDLCQKRGLSFQFLDTKCLSNDPPSFSATATVMGVTVTAEGITLGEAKHNCAAELLTKLGWLDSDGKEQNNLNRPGPNLSSAAGESDETVLSYEQRQLQKICSQKNLTFKYDCDRAGFDSMGRPMFDASLTCNGVTLVRTGLNLKIAKNKAAMDMINYLKSGAQGKEGIQVSHPSRKLQYLCLKKGLSFQFSDVQCLSLEPRRCRATATVLDVTVTAEGRTYYEAKFKVASEILRKLGWDQEVVYESKSQPFEEMLRSMKGSWKRDMSHPCCRLYALCETRGIQFQFRDCKRLSELPANFSATASVLNKTVTAEGPTLSAAKVKVALELIEKLGWQNQVPEIDNASEDVGSEDNSQGISQEECELNSSETTKHFRDSYSNDEWISAQKRLQEICSRRKLTFHYHDCQQYSFDPDRFNACLTVNGVTIARRGKKEWEAQNRAALAMIHYLSGKSVDFGYPTRRGYTLYSNIMSESEKLNPICQLVYLCKKRNIDFQFEVKNLYGSVHKCWASATILGVKVQDFGNHWEEVNLKVAVQMLAKLGWDETPGDTKKSEKNAELDKKFESLSLQQEPLKPKPLQESLKPVVKKELQESSMTALAKSKSSNPMSANPLFNNPKRSDITFIVGRPGGPCERVYGHSLVISLGSSVLDELFEGDWKDKEEVEIEGHPASFLSIMRYVYSQEIVLENDHLVETLLLAKKYGLIEFLDEIISDCHLTEEILKLNVLSLLQFSFQENEDDIWYLAASFFDKHCQELIREDYFLNLDVDVIVTLVRRSSLVVNELSLFYATILWAEKRCEEEGLEVSAENLRSKMDPFIHYIRFPLMTGDEFREGPGNTRILTGDECYKILLAICLGDKEDCGFDYNPRDTPFSKNIKKESHSFRLTKPNEFLSEVSRNLQKK